MNPEILNQIHNCTLITRHYATAVRQGGQKKLADRPKLAKISHFEENNDEYPTKFRLTEPHKVFEAALGRDPKRLPH